MSVVCEKCGMELMSEQMPPWWRGRYIVYRCLGRGPSIVFRPVARRWRLKAALGLAAEIAFDGRSEPVQVNWRTGPRTSRSVHIAPLEAFWPVPGPPTNQNVKVEHKATDLRLAANDITGGRRTWVNSNYGFGK